LRSSKIPRYSLVLFLASKTSVQRVTIKPKYAHIVRRNIVLADEEDIEDPLDDSDEAPRTSRSKSDQVSRKRHLSVSLVGCL
jgi:hypothetical protein